MVEEGVTLELEIEQLFEQGVREQSALGKAGRARGFHVSGLSYDCLRKIEYEVMAEQKDTSNHEEGEQIDSEGLWRTWIGTQLHATPITEKHEWELYKVYDINGTKVQLHGHIDEIYERPDGTEVVIDKKFTKSVPRRPNGHHIAQVSYYSALYAQQTGAKVEKGALFYFSPRVGDWPGAERLRVFTFPVDVIAAQKELDEKVRTVTEAIIAGQILERKTGWLCDYCRFREPCEALSGPVNGQKTLDGEKKE